MPNRQVAEWHVVCWYCKNTVNAENRVKCPYCGACLFLTPQDWDFNPRSRTGTHIGREG